MANEFILESGVGSVPAGTDSEGLRAQGALHLKVTFSKMY